MGTEGQAIGKGCRLWVDQDPTPSEQTESTRPLESGLPFVLSSHSLPLSIWSCNRNKTWQDKSTAIFPSFSGSSQKSFMRYRAGSIHILLLPLCRPDTPRGQRTARR